MLIVTEEIEPNNNIWVLDKVILQCFDYIQEHKHPSMTNIHEQLMSAVRGLRQRIGTSAALNPFKQSTPPQ